ncbi:rhodanese-like domain-containing protein [Fluviicola sp.]|jgi:rhodanese-related sulfurtransferase|uniref:rhodanese-like domain-containing protein n=1 Tax=Fluviicola sp. TaxID=1917219 RepID=UPI002826F1D6|nr:rhodanese-like domain-containing protein [Fluviicola sp.]MDR0801715.1 thioredoxin fold domain-containing protein [Fluviicola sp.]
MKDLTKQFIVLIFSTFFNIALSQKMELAPKSFSDSIQQAGIQLLDVRTSGEYEQGHLAGALQADWNNLGQFKERIASLDKQKPVYIYCLAGSRSAAAQKWMLQEGFRKVVNLQGGINAWNLENLPVESAKKVPQISLNDFLNSVPKDQTVLVDFGAEWCPPCKKMIPTVKELETEGYMILKIDAGSQTQLTKELNIEKLPTFIVFKNGVEGNRLTGFSTKEDLKKLLE